MRRPTPPSKRSGVISLFIRIALMRSKTGPNVSGGLCSSAVAPPRRPRNSTAAASSDEPPLFQVRIARHDDIPLRKNRPRHRRLARHRPGLRPCSCQSGRDVVHSLRTPAAPKPRRSSRRSVALVGMPTRWRRIAAGDGAHRAGPEGAGDRGRSSRHRSRMRASPKS